MMRYETRNAAADPSLLDKLTFGAMYGVLQSGMWLLNDLEKFLAPMKMSQGRLAILLNISESDEGLVSPMEIARITGKSRPTITKMIERLEKDGLIHSRPSPGDRRMKKLQITEAGTLLLDEIVPGYNRRLRDMSAGLTDDDKVSLLDILGRINFLDPGKRIAAGL